MILPVRCLRAQKLRQYIYLITLNLCAIKGLRLESLGDEIVFLTFIVLLGAVLFFVTCLLLRRYLSCVFAYVKQLFVQILGVICPLGNLFLGIFVSCT